jgi:two-component system sensor histidine kinase ChiS
MLKKPINLSHKLSLDFPLVLSLFASFTVITSLTLGYITYNNLVKSKMEKYITESNRAADTLSEAFNNVEKILHTIAKKIEITNSIKLEEIELIFKKIAKSPKINHDIFAWTMFDFVSPQGYVLVDSIRGVVKNPIKINYERRSWLESARTRPGELHFSSPDIGIVSGEEIIPTGYGVIDQDENFIGTISIGLNLKKLNQKLSNIIANQDLEFLIIDNNLKEHSRSKYIYSLKDAIKNYDLLKANALPAATIINPAIEINGIKYKYLSNVKFSPYYILIG